MVHLSNSMTLGAMLLYSILTFIIGPIVTRPLFGNTKDPNICILGFLVGFTVSIFLWMKYAKKLV